MSDWFLDGPRHKAMRRGIVPQRERPYLKRKPAESKPYTVMYQGAFGPPFGWYRCTTKGKAELMMAKMVRTLHPRSRCHLWIEGPNNEIGMAR